MCLQECGEDCDSDVNVDKEEDDEVVADTERDGLESEDMLTGTRSSLQGSGPFLFHGGESASTRLAEMGLTVGLPSEPVGVDGSATVIEVPAKGGGPATEPQEPVGVTGPDAASEAPAEGGGSTIMPQDAREASPSAQEQGAGSKRPCPNEVEQGPGGSSSKCIPCQKA